MSTRALVSMFAGEAGQLRTITLPVLEQHADRHGWALELAEPVPGIAHSWARVPALLGALSRHDAAGWVDADCLVTDPAADPFVAMPAGADVVTAWDDRFGIYCFTVGFRATAAATRTLRAMWDLRHHDYGLAFEQGALEVVLQRADEPRPRHGIFKAPWAEGQALAHAGYNAGPYAARAAILRGVAARGRPLA